MSRITRAERLRQIRALLASGFTHSEISAALGVSRSAVRTILNDPDGSKQRERRTRYQGRCGRCGRATDGSNGRAKAPSRCSECMALERHKNRRWTREAVIEAIQLWAREHDGQQPKSSDWLGRRADDRFPCMNAVARYGGWDAAPFTTWNAAIEAAGFTPIRVGLYKRTPETRARLSASQRRRHARQRAEREAA